jgi:ABC-type transporter Mla subunit MlaD
MLFLLQTTALECSEPVFVVVLNRRSENRRSQIDHAWQKLPGRVALRVQDKVKVYDDAVALIETDGFIGDRFVSIIPGTSDNRLDPRGRIAQTQSVRSLQYLLGKWVAGDLL